MPPCTPIPLITVDPKKKPREQDKPLHNRWHPDIPAVAEVKEGDIFRVESVDWTGGQIRDDDSAEDVKHLDLSQVHYLSGPIRVSDAEGKPAMPGDLLVVELCNLGALPGDEWGFTGTFDRDNGGGFRTDHLPQATKAIWYFDGIYATSRHIPGVRIPGLMKPGLLGTAPSVELLEVWNTRDKALADAASKSTTPGGVKQANPSACLPQAKGACLGAVKPDAPEWEKIASEAARTVPGRENGGNCDIKNLSRGCKVYFPVFVEGANLSMGDMHFSPGDGDASFRGAIKMSGFLELRCEIIRGGMEKNLSPAGPHTRFCERLVSEGTSVGESGQQHYPDASIAYKRAVLNCIDHLSKVGYAKEQIAASAPIQTAASSSNLFAAGLPSLSSRVSVTNATTPSNPTPAAPNSLASSWPNVSLSGQLMPNLVGSAVPQLPFQILNSCNNLLALQSVAASIDQAAIKSNAAACIDPQLAHLLAGQLKRKGKGGRQPATDPRLDPSIDPKKAKRILANRQSAAKSKMKQKLFVESLKQKHALMACQRQSLSQEFSKLSTLCSGLEAENDMLESSIKALAGLNGQANSLGNQGQTMATSSFLPSVVQPEQVALSMANVQNNSCLPTSLPTSNPSLLSNNNSCLQVNNGACLPWSTPPPPLQNQVQWWQLSNAWPLQHNSFTPGCA